MNIDDIDKLVEGVFTDVVDYYVLQMIKDICYSVADKCYEDLDNKLQTILNNIGRKAS